MQRREPLTTLTVAAMMIMGGAGVGTGAASLVNQHQEFGVLQKAVDEDLAQIQKSISDLTTSLNSLAEVVLQNRRGLDLLFFQ